MQTIVKPEALVEQLAGFEVFADVDQEALEWLVAKSTCGHYPVGSYVFKEGDPADHMTIVMEGEYVVSYERNGRKRELGIWGAGNVTGVLPFSRMVKAGANGVAIKDCTALHLHRDCFVEMVNVSYQLTQKLVSVMTSRVREFSQMRSMDEKLMALGKMSAGLAHELNNPASAMVRASDELKRHLSLTPERFKDVITMQIKPQEVDDVNKILFSCIDNYGESDMTLMEKEEFQDDVIDWLDDHDVENSEDMAETFLDFELGVEELDKIAEILNEEALPSVLWWMQANMNTQRLVSEIHTSSERIGGLVTSIKSYSHMDEDPSMELIDIHKGLKSTFTMLNFRLKKGNVAVDKEVNLDIPKIKALPGELNQVWTNLISNALDAVPETGAKLTIRTYQERDCVCVEIEDNGSGIPEDVQSRIFEPFFTTKGVGEGTGMGLDIVKRIIERHNGYIKMTSQPGATCFKVCFPINQDA